MNDETVVDVPEIDMSDEDAKDFEALVLQLVELDRALKQHGKSLDALIKETVNRDFGIVL